MTETTEITESDTVSRRAFLAASTGIAGSFIAGDVMYGNIGSHDRLDFTIIGPAVNMACRLEALTKLIGRSVLLSHEFAAYVEDDVELESVGRHHVRGFGYPIEVFSLGGSAEAHRGGGAQAPTWSRQHYAEARFSPTRSIAAG